MASEIKPYKIAVPDSAIAQLKEKLASATFFDQVDFADDWAYGAPRATVQRLAKYWRDEFDWRAQEAKINEQLPQFTTSVNVDGFGDVQLHFVHQTGSRKDSIPLLFCHGWPGNFLEVAKILPLLTNPEDKNQPSFHVVAPSLPNFGFSQGVTKRGFSIPQYSEAMHKLMLKLGYNRYVTQGGDWGFIITRLLGVLYPEHCLASHVNMVHANAPTLSKTPFLYLKHALTPYTSQERKDVARTEWFFKEGYGYNLLQQTRPNTIGFALADSPVALLAWVYEKLHDWTDDYPWTDDEALTWVSIYQFSTAGPAASARIYYECSHNETATIAKGFDYNGRVKLGLSWFPRDIKVPPRVHGHTLGHVVYEKRHERGGHFAAHETPDLLAGDLRTMFGPRGGAASVTKQLAKL